MYLFWLAGASGESIETARTPHNCSLYDLQMYESDLVKQNFLV